MSAVWHKRDSPGPQPLPTIRQLPVPSGNKCFQPIFTAGSVPEEWSCCCCCQLGLQGGFLLALQWEIRCKIQLWWWLLALLLAHETLQEVLHSCGSDCLTYLCRLLQQRALRWGVTMVTLILVRRDPPCSCMSRSVAEAGSPGGVLWVYPWTAALECSPFCSLSVRAKSSTSSVRQKTTGSLMWCYLSSIEGKWDFLVRKNSMIVS